MKRSLPPESDRAKGATLTGRASKIPGPKQLDQLSVNMEGVAAEAAQLAGHLKLGKLHFGVREHAMGSIANGLAAHGGIIPFTETFLTFSDYMRPAIRLAALMDLQVVYVFASSKHRNDFFRIASYWIRVMDSLGNP